MAWAGCSRSSNISPSNSRAGRISEEERPLRATRQRADLLKFGTALAHKAGNIELFRNRIAVGDHASNHIGPHPASNARMLIDRNVPMLSEMPKTATSPSGYCWITGTAGTDLWEVGMIEDKGTASEGTHYSWNQAVLDCCLRRISYPSGAVLALVTWAQRDHPHWFGGRIPNTPLMAGLCRSLLTDAKMFIARLKARRSSKHDANGAAQRTKFNLNLKPVSLP